jgi:hypothetical protein
MSTFLHIVGIPKNVKKEEIDRILNESQIPFISNKAIVLDDNLLDFEIELDSSTLEDKEKLKEKINSLKLHYHPNQKIYSYYVNPKECSCLILPKAIPNSEIKYNIDYDNSINTEYIKEIGSNDLIYTNKEFLEKQRNLFSYFIKKIGSNILQGKNIMNLSLPIFIFDTRSLLEMWVWQNGYCSIYLEKAFLEKDPLERIKYSTIYAMSKMHLCVAQQKPFNPILGETFQCKLNDSLFYLEQTSHHPPRTNFYVIGKNYKLFGYNEPDAFAGPNSFKIGAKGRTIILFNDGVRIYFDNSPMILKGTIFGDRAIDFTGNIQVIDESNDLICDILINPDNRSGFFNKFFQKKNTFPDYVSGIITSRKNNAKYNIKNKKYEIIDREKEIYSKMEGEFSSEINFDGKNYWKFEEGSFPKFYRQDFTLPSDSCYREDEYFLINNEESIAGAYKNVMEERQRRDRRLRNEYEKKNIKK